ncbi:MAG: aminopeptidase P N-terminal domain-containing protein [Flavobacteriales bacterium]|jgi:Xaa-Pro aminopeptidase|nr:aminopeptidase P N-terminal domain-containing protein [Flavobacteriales bacterium]|tara:strand:- start:26986 stop:28269 length:1284 start_codon:yes stop_codon:yes gene_type:complete
MKYNSLNKDIFNKNRALFSQKFEKNSLAIFNSNDIMPTNADGTMPFKQNSDLFWLSGIDQEESVLIIVNNNSAFEELLFLKETNEHIAIWEGAKLSKLEAQKNSGIQKVYWLDELEHFLKDKISEIDNVYLNKNIHARSSSEVQTRDDRFRNKIKNQFPNKKIKEIAPLMHKLRFIKSNLEVELMQHACNITEKGLRRILPIIKPGIMEYEIEAELMHEFLSNRSTGFAYQPIIGSGSDSCVLHYIENNKKCLDGDVLLMDFGAEYANYASDLTRTVPVNGVFSARQRNVYNAVHRVMKQATNMLRPGTDHKKMQQEVVKIMEGELITLGLFDRHDIKKQDPKNPLFKKYFMHGTSHSLGLDVHDVGDTSAPMAEGMVFTCEPGIYIRDEGIGIRLENDILITKGDPNDLMKNIPIEIDEIEELMNS